MKDFDHDHSFEKTLEDLTEEYKARGRRFLNGYWIAEQQGPIYTIPEPPRQVDNRMDYMAYRPTQATTAGRVYWGHNTTMDTWNIIPGQVIPVEDTNSLMYANDITGTARIGGRNDA